MGYNPYEEMRLGQPRNGFNDRGRGWGGRGGYNWFIGGRNPARPGFATPRGPRSPRRPSGFGIWGRSPYENPPTGTQYPRNPGGGGTNIFYPFPPPGSNPSDRDRVVVGVRGRRSSASNVVTLSPSQHRKAKSYNRRVRMYSRAYDRYSSKSGYRYSGLKRYYSSRAKQYHKRLSNVLNQR